MGFQGIHQKAGQLLEHSLNLLLFSCLKFKKYMYMCAIGTEVECSELFPATKPGFDPYPSCFKKKKNVCEDTGQIWNSAAWVTADTLQVTSQENRHILKHLTAANVWVQACSLECFWKQQKVTISRTMLKVMHDPKVLFICMWPEWGGVFASVHLITGSAQNSRKNGGFGRVSGVEMSWIPLFGFFDWLSGLFGWFFRCLIISSHEKVQVCVLISVRPSRLMACWLAVLKTLTL